MRLKLGILAPALLLLSVAARAETYKANHTNYTRILKGLEPGDTVLLEPDDYKDGITIQGLNGTPDAWIVIKGPESGTEACVLGNPGRNTIEIRGGTYVAIENLLIDGQDIDGIFAVNASGGPCHDIRIENCTIKGHGGDQSIVAISTKVPTWNWVIRRNRIIAPGTGIYLGNSDGTSPFIGGLIEYNLFLDSHGYNMEIKHQVSRDPSIPGIPTTPQKTIIRHNLFLKGELPNEGGARPNLLVGGYPRTGLGSEDTYEIYGNLFYHNHRESLLQAEGRVSIHDNVFVDCTGDGVHLQNHNDKLRRAYVYNNTFYGVETAIHFVHPALEDHLVAGNLMFSDNGITGPFTKEANNLQVPVDSAKNYVTNPSFVLGEMDFYPLPGKCQGAAIDLSAFDGETDSDRDFNGKAKGDHTFRGAYAGAGKNPGWKLTNEIIKGDVPPSERTDDHTPPNGAVRIAGGATKTAAILVDLDLAATDGASGMGKGAKMRFSNNGSTWSEPEPFAARRAGWDLSGSGGTAEPGLKVVYARFSDACGNWSPVFVVAIEYGSEPGPKGAGQ